MYRELTQQVTTLLEQGTGVAVDSSSLDLFESGVLDSLSFVNLLVELETAFGISIALDELDFDQFSTVDGIAAYVAAQRAATIARAG